MELPIISKIKETITEINKPIIKPIVANNISTALRLMINCSNCLKAYVNLLMNNPNIIKNIIMPMKLST